MNATNGDLWLQLFLRMLGGMGRRNSHSERCKGVGSQNDEPTATHKRLFGNEDYTKALGKARETMKELHALAESLTRLGNVVMKVRKDGRWSAPFQFQPENIAFRVNRIAIIISPCDLPFHRLLALGAPQKGRPIIIEHG
jgi:hypothetical protein